MTLLQKLRFIAISLVSAALVACGGGGGGPSVPAPVISAQPASISVYDTQDVTFSVTATDTSPITYQWKKNGVDIVGETKSTYVLKSSNLADNGALISVAVIGAGGTTTSAAATLTVIARAPKIATNPTPQSVVTGQTAAFSVSVTGLAPFTYQWLKNGEVITGATSSSFSSPFTLGDNSKQFSVVVTNSIGSVTSSPVSVSVQPSNLNNLLISEVSSCYYYNDACWFEIYNPTTTSINLGSYTIRSRSVDVTNGQVTASQFFTLPNISISPDSYLIISGNAENLKQRGTQNIRVRNLNNVPKWIDSGFIELLSAGATVDFVVFGSSSQTSTTANKWTGANVAALPYSANDYGKSIVRPYPKTANVNTYSSADWVQVDWATPAGRNDVPQGARDDDLDGIPDTAEVAGGTFAGLDLYAMGARTGKKDLFVEVDTMDSSDLGIVTNKESLQMVVAAFGKRNINVMFDAGNAFSSTFSVANFNLGQGSNIVPFEKCIKLDQTTCSSNISDRRSIYDWKEEFMDLRRRSVFHYLLKANTQRVDGSSGGPSGIAELKGNDLVITYGNVFSSNPTPTQLNQITNFKAKTIMHELGHNLGLRHGGFEDLNHKPNYYSIMNYLYGNGLDPDPSSATVYLRWRNSQGDKTPSSCSLVASPCGDKSQYIIDFSNGASADLDENALLESANIGRGSNSGAFADWDLSGSLTIAAIARDLNGDGIKTKLKDHDDWSNLIFPFVRYSDGNSDNSNGNKDNKRISPILNDRQEYIIEYFKH